MTYNHEAEVAKFFASRDQLPTLYGSIKQCEWALQIRFQILERLKAQQLTVKAPFIEWLRAQTSAGWWIDMRNRTNAQLLNEWMKDRR